MKKTFKIAVCICLLASTAALADTVGIISMATFSEPEGELFSTEVFSFRGTTDIIFEVAGRTCVLNGSARPGSQGRGCNYSITVKPDGTIAGELRAGSPACTPSDEVASSCKISCK